MKSQLSISVAEFLELERMSNGGIALLQHEHAHELEHEGGAIARPKELAGETAAHDPPRAHGNGDGHGGDGQGTKQQRLSMENSTRVALLLARSFVQFCELSEASHVNISHVLSAMKLDNFMISLDQQQQPQQQQQLSPDTDNYYENKEEEDFCSSKAKSAAPTQSQNRSQSQCSKPPLGPVSSSEPNHDDVVNNQETREQQEQQLQPGFFSQFDGNDGAYRDIYFSKPQKQIKKNNLSSSSSSSSSIKDVNGTQMGMGYFSCLSNHENNVSKLNDDVHVDDDVDILSCNNEGEDRKVEEHDDAINTVSVTQGSCSSSPPRRTNRSSSSVPAPQPPPKPMQWNLKKIDISFPNGVPDLPLERQHHSLHSHQHHQSHYSRAQAMQKLGRLLYSIFSHHHHIHHHHHGESPSSDLSPNGSDEIKINNNDNNNNNGKYGEQRPCKRTRDANGSVFSQLLDTKAFPISICRYLSDLMSMGSSCSSSSSSDRNNASHIPFDSFQDSLNDLSQMISQPEVFLHDSYFPYQMTMHQQQQQQPHPTFGQKHYGRKKEMARLLEASIRMEKTASLHNNNEVNNDNAQQHQPQHNTIPSIGLESVFVSGIAGAGKSHLVFAAAETLSSSRRSSLDNSCSWIVITAKFDRGAEHTSRGIVSSMFNQVISYMVKMKGSSANASSPADVEYSSRASNAIMNTIGMEGLVALVAFLPALPLLFDGISTSSSAESVQLQSQNNTEWQLIYCLTKIIEAVLEADDRRFIMIFCDDLQWADRTSLSLVTEVLKNIAGFKGRLGHRCLYVGSYRENDAIASSDTDRPLFLQYSYLQKCGNINTTDIKLSSLSKEDVAEMLMAEFRLPRRFVTELADVVFKKTSGHAFYVVELLSSLVRDSTIAYSLEKHRYDWDPDSISFIQTGDNVAELIASNMKSLPPSKLKVLQIVSCLGMQTELSLLEYLEKYYLQSSSTGNGNSNHNGSVCVTSHPVGGGASFDRSHQIGQDGGIISSLEQFIEQGILDRAGPLIMFCHDLIHQTLYESMPENQRQILHLEIGNFLGELALPESMELGGNHHRNSDQTIFFTGKVNMMSSLISIACDQINSAGPAAVKCESLKVKFASWNSCAGRKDVSNFLAAHHYFSKGILFLTGKESWLKHPQLCLELYEGVVLSSYSLGEAENAIQYAQEVVKNVPFEDTMVVQTFLLKALAQLERFEECISQGLSIFRRLNVDIPSSPSAKSIASIIENTENLASKCSDQIESLCEKVIDSSAHCIIKIMDSFYAACWASASSFLPVIACIIVQYSLQHGICQEAGMAFGTIGMFKIFLSDDFASGRKWSDLTRKITKKHQAMKRGNVLNFPARAHILLYIAVDIWFENPRAIARKLLEYHNNAMRMGQVDYAMFALNIGLRFKYFGGENLSILSQSFDDHLRLVAKHSKHALKYMILDGMLLKTLTGSSGDSFSLIEGSICNIADLRADAESSKDNRLLHNINVVNTIISYWRGDYAAAENYANTAREMYPTSKLPTLFLIYHTFFHGLVLFHQHRAVGNCGDRLKEGMEMMNEMGKWAQNSMSAFEGKWVLLKAEYFASVHEYSQAIQMYNAAIKVALAHDNIHELGIAYELLGKHYLANGCEEDSNNCFKKAFVCYNQWGATAVAEKIIQDHNLDRRSITDTLHLNSSKRSRQPH